VLVLWMLVALAGLPGTQAAAQSAPHAAAQPPAGPAEILVMLHLPAPHFRADGYSSASSEAMRWRASMACRLWKTGRCRR
jgi:hypothetical protein